MTAADFEINQRAGAQFLLGKANRMPSKRVSSALDFIPT
jgi:hypothetical protein